jgi:dihydroxyacetone kinase-like protein
MNAAALHAATDLTAADLAALIRAAHNVIADHADELTALDSAIGDADHGVNMKRGFDAMLAKSDEIAGKPLPEALKAAGLTLVMTVGGASGPLFGTFLMSLGKEIGASPDRATFARAVRSATDAVAARGKSERGQKTMLDVLYPVAEALASGKTSEQIVELAHESARATAPMKAIRGRASFLGDRSIGHIDAGARSTALLVETAAAWLEKHR